MNLKRKTAITAAALAVAALGGTGLAMAAQSSTPAPASNGGAMSSLADTAVAGAAESESAKDDGPNQGPDADANEPGHQDATDVGDANEANESESAKDDGPNQGPDANASEEGHQDAVDDDPNEAPESTPSAG